MDQQSVTAPPLELWAGIECTVNRVGDAYFDQLERSGHAARIDDLDLIAALGVRAVRYPVLWERIAPDGLARADWSWPDARLGRLRELGIKPIVGLLHHGSGPRHTSLIDSAFVTEFTRYARAVAERFEWVEDYTPVNEPLTTARFSGLYGHWYPHGRDALTFARALLAECRATALAMRAIRRVNPAARLVQTEDLGKTFSTPRLAYQAEFENERRWLTFDLLSGLVGRAHPMWSYLRHIGVGEDDLLWFVDNPCAANVMGINHYLTSERFLDERLERYPDSLHGGNGRHRYADVEAVRVCRRGSGGPLALLREAWQRYQTPIAITEVHLGCTREEQLRWLNEVWGAAQRLWDEGVEVRAVTAWALLGSFDWNCLLTRQGDHYEPGAFDLRAPQPRATAIAHMLRSLAAGRAPDHPALDSIGWWRRRERFLYPPVIPAQAVRAPNPIVTRVTKPARPILITGATGTLGRAFARVCAARGLAHRLLTRQEMDIANPRSVRAALSRIKPWAVINAAGYVRVDEAEQDAARCGRENRQGPATLAAHCAAHAINLVTFSSDLVFDGERTTPYVESDRVAPLSAYGESKAQAEAHVLQRWPGALVIRTSAFFGPWDDYNFVTLALRALAEGREFIAADDLVVSPTYVPDLVNSSLDLLIDGERGIWHLANAGAVTWAELARRAAMFAGLSSEQIKARPVAALGLIAPRPRYAVLGSERGTLMPSLEDALSRYWREVSLNRPLPAPVLQMAMASAQASAT
ncbi:MAG TPA: family 1 glycosylhydrolase [Blastocatellia bacterium]|nr:family 1 glycosylhydrolase [Blastocatellia bacterium]